VTIKPPTVEISSEPTLPAGVVLKPPVRFDDLAAHIDEDPAEAEALVALVRELRLDHWRK
jgi:hypothetical protein